MSVWVFPILWLPVASGLVAAGQIGRGSQVPRAQVAALPRDSCSQRRTSENIFKATVTYILIKLTKHERTFYVLL